MQNRDGAQLRLFSVHFLGKKRWFILWRAALVWVIEQKPHSAALWLLLKPLFII